MCLVPMGSEDSAGGDEDDTVGVRLLECSK